MESQLTITEEGRRRIDVLDHGFVELVDSMGDDNRIAQSARVSYGTGLKGPEQDAKLVRYLLRNAHTSPFEQVVFTFHMSMPIFVARQIVRHRTARLNEISARYTELEDKFYIPKLERIQGQGKENKQGSSGSLEIEDASCARDKIAMNSRDAYEYYQELLELGVSRELARMVLPLNIYTRWYWQMDLNNLFKFLKLRLDPHAQYEVQVYAEAIYELIDPICPVACEAFDEYILQPYLERK